MSITTPWYPVMLRLTGKRVLVVGGGKVATRKVEGLAAAGAIVTVVAPFITDELLARPDITTQQRPYAVGEVEGYWLAVVSTDDAATQQQVFDDGERLGVWVNAADDPDRCSFILPAVVRRGPVVATISTGGASPALAQELRDRVAGVLPANVERVAAELEARRRAVQAAGQSTEAMDWRPLVQRLLDDE